MPPHDRPGAVAPGSVRGGDAMTRIAQPEYEEEQVYLPLVEPVRSPGHGEPVPAIPEGPEPGSHPVEQPEEVPA